MAPFPILAPGPHRPQPSLRPQSAPSWTAAQGEGGAGDKAGPRRKRTEEEALALLTNHPYPKRCKTGMYVWVGDMRRALRDEPQAAAPHLSGHSTWRP